MKQRERGITQLFASSRWEQIANIRIQGVEITADKPLQCKDLPRRNSPQPSIPHVKV